MQGKEDKFDAFTVFLGFVAGYALFAGYLLLYDKFRTGRFDSDDLGWRLLTPFVFQAGHWTDLLCYLLITLSVLGVAKVRRQL